MIAWVLKFLSTQCGIEVSTTTKMFKKYENSFTTDTLVSWFEYQRLTGRKKALEFIQKLHKMCIVTIVSGESEIIDSTTQILQIQVKIFQIFI